MALTYLDLGLLFVFSEIWILNFGGENIHYSKNTMYIVSSKYLLLGDKFSIRSKEMFSNGRRVAK